MRLDLGEDAELFRDTSRRFLAQSCDLAGVRALADAGGGFDPAWWREGAALGWTSLLVPDEYGGAASLGNGLVDLAIVAETMGEYVSPGPLLPTSVVATAITAWGTDSQRASVLPPLVAGELVAAWCHADAITATRTGDDYVLDGTVFPVEGADQADVLLVTALVDERSTQFLVPRAAEGVSVVDLECLDLVRHFGEVRFDGTLVSAASVVGPVGAAGAALDHQLAVALVLQCAECTGAARAVFERTVEYAFDRYSFGRPLASYQALKHRFADMRMWLESCQATTDAAACAVADGAPDALVLARVAKAYVGDHSPEIIQDCIQLHGGIGVTWEHDLHVFLRRVVVDRAVHGAPSDHRVALGRAVAGASSA